MSAIVTDIRDAVGNEKGITLTGASAISKDINTASQRDLMTAEAIGLPIAIIILLFAFGTVVASFVPLNYWYCDCRILVRCIGDSRRKNGPVHFRLEYHSDARTCAQYRLRFAVH